MQNIFLDARLLDKAARENYGLTEDIMMENAAAALESYGKECFFAPDKKYITRPTVLVLAGAGNNGADGYALARRIVQHEICVTVCQVYEPKSAMCVLQAERAKKAGVIFINPYDLDDWLERTSFDLRVVYDCVFGSGFHGELDALCSAVIQSVNKIEGAFKIACDIPTGAASTVYNAANDSGISSNCSQNQNAAAAADCKAANDSGISSNQLQDQNAARNESKPTSDSRITSNRRQAKEGAAFIADLTVTMGALKLCLYSDRAKDACGKIVVADLGISRTNYEAAASSNFGLSNNSGIEQKFLQAQEAAALLKPCAQLLEKADARLPFRSKKQNSNKGTFGHTAVFCGEKAGAAVIAGHAALKFGSGLVSLLPIAGEKIQFEKVEDFELMISDKLPQNATALVIGPGLGRPNSSQAKEGASNDSGLAGATGKNDNFSQAQESGANDFGISSNSCNSKKLSQAKEAASIVCGLDSIPQPLVLDADIFYYPQIKELLEKKKNLVLTPHPKEFAELLKNCGLGNYSVQEAVQNRFALVKEFAEKFPERVLLLKGSNVLIASKLQGENEVRVYINPLGTSALAKGGSGDVLSGMIGALLAQGYSPLDAAASASIAHASASRAFDSADYALTPFELMEKL
ncbi:MAG: NAD(P)H-hydrate epimerase [Treponema sp.]|nr:NAD(P)H-hydrate epimerase [Treponema sp.]